jgi:DNA-binding transcriptional LysR family regulator
MDLNEILVFARVVEAGSFTTAAAQLGMPKSTVSRKVSELEERLKSRLLQRTTRKRGAHGERPARYASGLLRVTAPTNAAFLGPIVSAYLKRYPEVDLSRSRPPSD